MLYLCPPRTGEACVSSAQEAGIANHESPRQAQGRFLPYFLVFVFRPSVGGGCARTLLMNAHRGHPPLQVSACPGQLFWPTWPHAVMEHGVVQNPWACALPERERAEGREAVRAKRGRNPRSTRPARRREGVPAVGAGHSGGARPTRVPGLTELASRIRPGR